MMRCEERWATSALDAFVESDAPGLCTTPGEVDYLGCLRQMLLASTPLAALGLRMSIWMVALAPLWLWGRPALIDALDRRQRTQLLQRLLAHRLFAVRELLMLLKLTASIALLGTASVRARSSYDHKPPVPRVRLPLAS